jgi:hypothetical protein
MLGVLMEALDARVPKRLGSSKTSIFDARLDDVVFREIRAACGDHDEEPHAGLLKQLFGVYEVAPPLPRLSEVVSAAEGSVDLSNAVVVAHQHVLGTVVSQFEAMWQLGLLPSRTYVLGKPYSTNRLAAMYLESKGCSVRDGLQPISASPRWAIQAPDFTQTDNEQALGHIFGEIVKRLPEMNVAKLIVLDDGGLVLGWLNRAFDTGLFTAEQQDRLGKLKVVGVEQTTFGRHLIERLGPSGKEARSAPARPVPVANVAETRLKLEKESILIAESVARELDNWIRCSADRGRHVRNLREAVVGVVGFGVVGSWICRVLQHLPVQRIVVFDSDVSHSSIARSFGFHVAHSLPELAAACSVIIGCTGSRSGMELTADMLKPRTILASASSGNYEFARVFLSSRKEGRTEINPEVTPNRGASPFDWVHSIFQIGVPEGIAYVLNGGFPINFTGGVDPIRAEDIELTRCLIVAGVIAALKQVGEQPNFGGPVHLVGIDEEPLHEMFGT